MSFLRIVSIISVILIGINAILYFKSFRVKPKAFKVFSLYIGMMFIVQTTFLIIAIYKVNNILLSHIYYIFQFILLSLFYKELINGNGIKKGILWVMFLTLAIILTQFTCDPSLINTFNPLEIILTSCVMIVYSVIFFYQSLEKRLGYSFINAGVFIYLVGSTLIFATANYTSFIEKSFNRYIWNLNSILFVLYQLLIFIEWKKIFSTKEEI